MRVFRTIILLSFLWVALSAHDGGCSSPPTFPLVDSVTVTGSSNGNILPENADSWIDIHVKGRNFKNPGLKVCVASNLTQCATLTTFEDYATSYKARLTSWYGAGTYAVTIENHSDEYEPRRSNRCTFVIH